MFQNVFEMHRSFTINCIHVCNAGWAYLLETCALCPFSFFLASGNVQTLIGGCSALGGGDSVLNTLLSDVAYVKAVHLCLLIPSNVLSAALLRLETFHVSNLGTPAVQGLNPKEMVCLSHSGNYYYPSCNLAPTEVVFLFISGKSSGGSNIRL